MTGLLLAVLLAAQEPEQCLAKRGEIVVTHGGKTYRLANEACRAQFLSDPERYAQLYDALLELEAEGTPLAPATASLVPS
ncbi:MAG TPA: hypothetical protein VHL59_16045 [Thermoanaerobaculia bacterium]|nr:hypothetical protein [Thermoanaerobaculia bacterium]